MKCPGCNAGNPPEHKFCSQCAWPLISDSSRSSSDAKPRYCGGCGASLLAAAATPEPVKATISRSQCAAPERRHLTVMFCDLVGSTYLSARIDPEDLSNILRQYQRACGKVINSYDGYVARYAGDGLLAYFGYPCATEHDAERAVRAGLDIIAAVHKLRPGHGLTLQTRIGISSGDVVVGEVVGEGGSREETVVGETPNLAARLQDIAAPDAVVISGRTQKLIGGLFEYSDLGYPKLKGFEKPIHAYAVCRESAEESRIAANDVEYMGPLLGREQELDELRDCWLKVCNGSSQLVVISGEAGIGKSHLSEYFCASLTQATVEVLRIYGSPHTTGIVLHPIIEYWKRLAGIEPTDDAGVQLDRLERRLAKLGPYDPQVLALMATLLAVPVDGRYQAPLLSPSALKFRILELLVSQVARQCVSSPVVLVLEDLQWMDAGSVEFLDLLTQQAKDIPLLVIVTYRSEFSKSWQANMDTTHIVLNRLETDAARDLIGKLTLGEELPKRIVADILYKTDGVPLFIRELTRSVLESPLPDEIDDCYTLDDDPSLLSIPSRVHNSLMSRLDGSAAVKEVAQVGSAMGREFRLDLLRAVTDWPAEVVDRALTKLVEAGLVIRRGSAPHQAYIFRHALLQEAAYESMLHSTRRLLHARIAETLEQEFPEQVANRPELLAHHYTAAELHEQGFRYWYLASQHALRHFAHNEVVAYLQSGLEVARKLKNDDELSAMAMKMRAMLGSALGV